MTAADFISCEWDEDGLHLRIDTDDGLLDLNISDPVEFYRAVRLSCDEWIAEMEAARREYITGRADNPAMQALIEQINGMLFVEELADVEPLKRAVQPDWDAVRDRERGK